MTTDSATSTPNTPTPPDATEVFGWVQRGNRLATRAFAGKVQQAAGFTVRVEGVQRENHTCTRWVTIGPRNEPAPAWSGSPHDLMEPQAARQLAAALVAAADEIEAQEGASGHSMKRAGFVTR